VACRKVGSPRRPLSPDEQRAAARARKVKRVSESELYGAVKCNLAALLTRGGTSSRAVGPSYRVVHGDQQPRRPLEQNPSPPRVRSSELGHVARRSAPGSPGRRCQPARRYREGRPARGGPQRIVDQAKARGNARDTGVVPGHRTMELNSTTAEGVSVLCRRSSHEGKAC